VSLLVHGIGSCDACRKARRWLDERGIAFEWVDLRELPQTAETVSRWLDEVGAERLVNRRSTTWRELAQASRPALDCPELPEFLVAHPLLIKRPVFDTGDAVRVGFDDEARAWLKQR